MSAAWTLTDLPCPVLRNYCSLAIFPNPNFIRVFRLQKLAVRILLPNCIIMSRAASRSALKNLNLLTLPCLNIQEAATYCMHKTIPQEVETYIRMTAEAGIAILYIGTRTTACKRLIYNLCQQFTRIH